MVYCISNIQRVIIIFSFAVQENLGILQEASTKFKALKFLIVYLCLSIGLYCTCNVEHPVYLCWSKGLYCTCTV